MSDCLYKFIIKQLIQSLIIIGFEISMLGNQKIKNNVLTELYLQFIKMELFPQNISYQYTSFFCTKKIDESYSLCPSLAISMLNKWSSIWRSLIIIRRDMSDCDDFMKVLKGWREQDSKSILQVLTRITQIKTFTNQELDDVLKVVVDFHREIGKAEEGEVDPKWFELTINLKKKLKKMQETQKSKTEKPKMEKKPSLNVEIPESLLAGRGPGDQQMLRSLYKNFVTFFDEATKQQSTIQFIQGTLKEIKFMFEDSMRQEAMHKRINSICNRLSRESCKQAKQKMLRGEITPRQLAEDDDEIYFDEKTREAIRKNQLAQLEECRTGFYDEMKKNVNKDACEECRYCHQKKAFCEDMKQIRASDQPMTRFMKCNNCNKAWRD